MCSSAVVHLCAFVYSCIYFVVVSFCCELPRDVLCRVSVNIVPMIPHVTMYIRMYVCTYVCMLKRLEWLGRSFMLFLGSH